MDSESVRSGWRTSTAMGVDAGLSDRDAMPPRPALPPVLGCALGLWCSCAAVLEAAATWEVGMCLLVAGFGAAWAACALVLLWRKRAAMVWAAALGLALGLACGGGFAAHLHTDQARVQGLQEHGRFEAVADGAAGSFGSSCYARTALSDGTSVVVRVLLPEGEEPLRFGEVFEADAAFSAPATSSAAYSWRQGAVADARVSEIGRLERGGIGGALVEVRTRAVQMLAQNGGSGAGVLAALVCGWRGDLNEDTYASFKATGLAHLVAVSGAHLAIVSAFVAGALRALRVPRAAAAAVQGALILCYLVLAACPPSAIRAAAMAFAGMFSFAAHRRPASLSALSVCMIGFVGLAPQTALSVSFALSALSTLGIVLFAGLATAWIGRCLRRLPRFACEALALTCASSILATPLSAALFSQLPLVAPLANVVATPLFAPVCAGGLVAVAGALALPAAASVLIAVAGIGADALVALVDILARIPFASVPVAVPIVGSLAVSAALAIVLWIIWPRPRPIVVLTAAVACAVAFGCALLVVPRIAGDEIVMLDVGQGDAFVIRSKGSAVLVDTGNQDRLLREALARHGIVRLDAIIVTHGDDDHMGSLSSLAHVVQVDRVLVADDAFTCSCDACGRLLESARALVGEDGVQGLSAGDGIQVGVFDLRVVWPEHFQDEGGNADSLCLVSDADIDGDAQTDWRALFVGDAERDQLRVLLDSGQVGDVDVYKVGHHGSRNALDDEEAAELSPAVALVSAGANNRYGHPTQETLDRLAAVGTRIVRTDLQGDVTCTLLSEEIRVTAQRP